MGPRRILPLTLLGMLVLLKDSRSLAQEPQPNPVAPQTIYRLKSGSPPTSSPESIQQSDPQATLTRSPHPADRTQPTSETPPDQRSESAPVFQLDLQREGEISAPGQGAGLSGPGTPGSGDSEAGSGGTPGLFGREGDGVRGPDSGGSGLGSGSPGTGSGEGAAGSGTGGAPGASAQRYPQTTGLIVDARGLDFQPSMSMRLFDPEGNQVYTTPTANQDLNAYLVASSGTAAYVNSEADARALTQRIGERPLEIKAIKTLGYDLVVSNEDAWALRRSNQVDQFLDNYAVVVIWDSPY